MTNTQQDSGLTSRPGIPWVKLILGSILSLSKTSILVITLVATLALNVATLTKMPVFHLLSSAVELVTDLMAMKSVRSKYGGEITSLKKQVRVEKNYSAALKNQIDVGEKHTKKQIDAAEKHMKSLDDDKRALKKKNLALKEELNRNRYVQYKGKKTLIKDAVNDTSGRISRRVVIDTARNTGSMAAEAIPYIGIAAIVGTTTWELRDACETMKDLHALDVAFNPDAANDADAVAVCGKQVPTKEEIIAELKQSPAKAWEAAKDFDLPDLPSWDEAVQAARETWWKIARFMKSTLGL